MEVAAVIYQYNQVYQCIEVAAVIYQYNQIWSIDSKRSYLVSMSIPVYKAIYKSDPNRMQGYLC